MVTAGLILVPIALAMGFMACAVVVVVSHAVAMAVTGVVIGVGEYAAIVGAPGASSPVTG